MPAFLTRPGGNRHVAFPTRARGAASVKAMGPRSADLDGHGPDSPVERRIRAIAAAQLHLVTIEQLAVAGLGPRGVRHRAGRGALHRMHQNVYALHPPPHSPAQRRLAATMTYGPGTRLSHGPAGVHQAFYDGEPGGPIHVSTPRPGVRSRDGIVCHAGVEIDPRDRRSWRGVPCVSADLVLVQLVPALDEGELEKVMVAADSLGFLKRGRLAELVGERRGRPGMPKLERLLQLEPAYTQSDLELLFLPLWRPAGLERPLVNHPVPVPGRAAPLLVDFVWPRLRMAVEADSQRFHGDWERAEIDRDRDQLLALAGTLCHRFVRRRVKADPAGCAERLRRLALARERELGLVARAA